MPTYKQYLKSQPNYLELLSGLKAFVTATRDHVSEQKLNLSSLLEFVDLLQNQRIPINSTFVIGDETKNINLVTAHGAKGLEFENVFVLHCNKEIWEGKSKSNLLSPPMNLNISPPKDNIDDKIKLFYVSLTRAKRNLYLTRATHSVNDKILTNLGFLENKIEFEKIEENNPETHEAHFSPIRIKLNINVPDKAFLEPVLKNYKLSVTHLNNFLNITGLTEDERGGPKKFLELNLLRYPQAKHRSNSFGTAMHETIRIFLLNSRAQSQILSVEMLLETFEKCLSKEKLNDRDFSEYLRLGQKHLRNYYVRELIGGDFSCYLEFDFANHNIEVGKSRITGKIDKIQILKDQGSLLVTDFKTGKVPKNISWKGGNEFESIKLENYKRQLIFYKLLIDNSSTFKFSQAQNQTFTGQLEFFESPKEIIKLKYELKNDEAKILQKLISVVWKKIMNLDFPDTSRYSNSFQGNLEFIEDLIQERI